MTNQRQQTQPTPGAQPAQSSGPDTHQRGQSEANERTEAQVHSADGQAGQSAKSSGNAKSHTKAGQQTGAGGGKKQARHH
jgi:hypothetical protein